MTLTPTYRPYQTPFGEWLVTSDDHDGRMIATYGKGKKARAKAERHAQLGNASLERLADKLRASLAIEDEIRDTLAAYEYLAEWEAGAHRGGNDDQPILRLRRSHRVPQTQE